MKTRVVSVWGRASLLVVACLVGVSSAVKAIPTLELDASNGVYNVTVASTQAATPVFTLFALLNGTPVAGDTYWVDVALWDPSVTTPASLGSLVFNGTTVNVTSGMTEGNPGLPPHGVYDTYYKPFEFTWNSANTFTPYDTSSVPNPHLGPSNSPGTGGLYQPFSVDLSGLAAGTEVWFDLWEVNSSGGLVTKAPFSHDVFTAVPEPRGYLINP